MTSQPATPATAAAPATPATLEAVALRPAPGSPAPAGAASSDLATRAVPATMQAVTRSTFGSPDVLRLDRIPTPVPGEGQVLVRVRATGVNPWDWHFLRGTPYIARLTAAGLRRPKHPVLGGDVAGEVVALGEGATRFAIGDRVFGFIEFGGFAEYAAVPETALAAMPATGTFEEAAAVPLAATTALQGLRDAGRLAAGERVLIIGASGGVGTFAVQVARALGASVTAVASGRNAALVRSLGADRAIDYGREDATAGGDHYDVVLQLAGTASGAALGRILAPGGRAVMSSGDSPNRWVGPFGRVIRGMLAGKRSGRSIAPLTARWNAEDLATLAGMLDAGAIRPVIDRTYALAGTADAIRHLETGHPRGKVVVSVAAA